MVPWYDADRDVVTVTQFLMDIPHVRELVMKMTHAQFIVTTITDLKETLKSTVTEESGQSKAEDPPHLTAKI